MSMFQRMIAIPQEEYLQLSSVQNVRQPLTQQFYNLESQYNKEAQIADPYKRLISQSNTLEDMKQLKDQMRHYITVSTPKPYRSRAQALLENVSSFLRYNERGEIFDNENNTIENSRLEDLIQHAVRDRRRNMSPVGWEYFLNLLRRHNVPKSILNRNTIEEMEQQFHNSVNGSLMQIKLKKEADGHITKRKTVKKSPKRLIRKSFPERAKSTRIKKPTEKFFNSLKFGW